MNIFLLEDDEAIGIGLKYSLENEGYTITLTRSFAEAESIIEKQTFALYILDINLPDGSGYDICRKVKEKGDFPVIFLTAYDDEVNVVMGLDIGADDYITKPFGTAELRARVNAHLRRDTREKKNSFSISGIVFHLNAKEAESQEQKLPLTKSEYEICEYLALHHGQTFTREQIYEAVFGFDGESDNSVISTHIKNIRGKLAAYNMAPIETVWGVGYKWV